MTYSIIPPGNKYPLSSECAIITGTPFLYLSRYNALVLGDLHLGHESALMEIDSGSISESCQHLTQLVLQVIQNSNIDMVVCNGDIKHNTKDIKIQELEELKYFTSKITSLGVNLVFLEGNHDLLLEYMIPYIDHNQVSVKTELKLGNILIRHGHEEIENYTLTDIDTIILSHEHPAYTFRGTNRARVKLPAFLTIDINNQNVIVLPAANSISSGVNYPIFDQKAFLSPILRDQAKLSSMEIFPIDLEYGLFELPSTNLWS